MADVTQHTLRPAPPVRAFLIAALATLLGAVLAVAAHSQQWHVAVLVIAVIVLLAGLALLGAGIVALTRMTVRGELTDQGYEFRTPRGIRSGKWADTVQVLAGDHGSRLTFVNRDESTVTIVPPLGDEDPAYDALVRDITARLDASRS